MIKFYTLKAITVFFLACFSLAVFGQVPVINSFSPSSGPIGTPITINGTDLLNPMAITIGGATAIVISNTGTSLVVLVMPGTENGVISLTTADGTASSASNFTVTASAVPNSQQGPKLVGTGITGTTPTITAVSLSADGNTAIIGGYSDDGGKGAVWFYTRSAGVWTQQGPKMVGTGGVGAGSQGWAVSISADGNTAVSGAYVDNTVGALWVWIRNNGVWTQQGSKLVGTGGIGASRFGYSVDISADGNTIISGGYNDDAPNSNSSKGAAWVWTRSGTTWTQEAKLFGTGATGYARQGISVSLSADGNTALVGGYSDDSDAGAIWFFTRSGTTWTQQGEKVSATGNIGPAQLGNCAALSADGNTAVVGGYMDDNNVNPKGAVWIFTRNGGLWSQQGNKLIGANSSADAGLGSSVSISGDGNIVIVGGQSDNNGVGAVWFFTRSNGTWSQYGEKFVGAGSTTGPGLLGGLIPTTPRQGLSVALSADGNTAMEGATFDNNQTGAIWALTKIPPPTISAFTSLSARVGSLITIDGTNIGYTKTVNIGGKAAVIVSNTATAVVAMVMPGTTNGSISLTTSSGTATATGSFTIISTLAPNTQLGNKQVGTGNIGAAQQGSSLSISADGNTAIVGAPLDNSSQGATWVYIRSGETWVQQAKLVGTGNTGAAKQGTSVSLSADGNTILVGGPGDNASRGAIWIFSRSGETWTQTGKFIGAGVAAGALQGYAVALSADGNTAIVGGYKDGSNKGTVWTFARNGTTWSPQGEKVAGTGSGAAAVQLGRSVFLNADGTTAIFGANTATGAAWVYTWGGAKWVKQATLVGTGSAATTAQGTSVALSADGNTAISGGPGADSGVGAAWVWTRNGTTWTSQGKLVGTGSTGNSGQGQYVSLSANGNIAMVGGNNDNTGQGASWMYNRSSSTWTQDRKLLGTGNIGAAQQGFAVFLSADGATAMSSAPIDDSNQGASWTYVYTPPPVITSFTPASAILGSTVTLTGTDFTGATAVSFGGVAATSFSVVSATSITAVVGAGASGEISVTTPYGTGTLSGFTFLSGNAKLSALALSGLTLAPDFDASTITYTVAVSNIISTIRVTPTTAEANATVTVNGTAVVSGSASEEITLAVGDNTITTVVRAQDGTTIETYTVTITRAKGEQTITFAALTDKTYGDAPFSLTATGGGSGNAVTYVSSNTAVATITGGTVTVVGAGTTTITASQAGNADFDAAISVGHDLTVGKAVQTITFAALTDKTYGDAPFSLTATGGGSGNAVTYVSSNTAVATITGGTVTVVGAGTTTITASQAGNADFSAAISVGHDLTVGKAVQTITFAALTDKTYGDAPFSLTATGGGSGNAVTYVSSNTAVATITGSTVTVVGAGTTTITASQSGNADFSAAISVGHDLTVGKGEQTITFAALTDKTYGDAPFSLTATGGGSGNAVTYVSSNTAVATITGGTVTVVGAGTTTITASQSGNADFSAAISVGHDLTVGKGEQTITFAALTDKTYGDAPFSLTATGGGSGNAVTYVSSNTAVATITGSTVTVVGAGTTTITASQAGNADFSAAISVDRILTVSPGVLPVSLTSYTAKIDGNRTRLAWTTASEQNNERFEIERSVDGKIFIYMSQVGGNGTTSNSHSYIVYDSNPANGTTYYKLKQYDLNGRVEELGIKSVNFKVETIVSVRAFPNPTTDVINLSFTNYHNPIVKVVITDLLGRIIHTESILLNTGDASNKLKLNGKLIPGLYFINVNGEGLKTIIKLIVH